MFIFTPNSFLTQQKHIIFYMDDVGDVARYKLEKKARKQHHI